MRDNALMTAIRIIGSQQKLALKLGITRKVVNAWVNRGILVPVHHALDIEVLTLGRINAEDLSPHAKQKIINFKYYLSEKIKQN